MNENYNVSDYGIFSNAINSSKNINTKVDDTKTILTECEGKLNESTFMGPAADSCLEGLHSASSKLTSLESNFTTISDYLVETSNNYQKGDTEASNTVLKVDSGTVTTGSSGVSLTGNTNQDQIYNYFSSQGYNKAAICGILANIQRESNFRTDALGDNGTSYGICQWHNSRWDNLKSYCQQNGMDSTTLEGQLSFLTYELQKYPELVNTLKNVPNTAEGAYEAAYQWTVKFERPANMDSSGKSRGNTASTTFWNAYQE